MWWVGYKDGHIWKRQKSRCPPWSPRTCEVWAGEASSLVEVPFLPVQEWISVDCTHLGQCRDTRDRRWELGNGAGCVSIPSTQQSCSLKALCLQLWKTAPPEHRVVGTAGGSQKRESTAAFSLPPDLGDTADGQQSLWMLSPSWSRISPHRRWYQGPTHKCPWWQEENEYGGARKVDIMCGTEGCGALSEG